MKTLFAGICAVTAALFLVFNVSAFSDESSSAELQIGKLLQNQVVDLVCKGDLIGDGVFEYAVLSHKKGSEHYEGGGGGNGGGGVGGGWGGVVVEMA